MAIKLTEDDFQDIHLQAQQQGEQVWQPLELGSQSNLSKQIGAGGEHHIPLRNGLTIYIRQCHLWQTIQHTKQHESSFPLTAKF